MSAPKTHVSFSDSFGRDLRREWGAILRPDLESPAGIPRICRPLVAQARITIQGKRFEFADHDSAALAYISPVRAVSAFHVDHFQAAAVPFFGDLVDLVAWHPQTPDQWALRLDAASWIGCAPLQHNDSAPARIYRSVYSWLCAKCFGLCLLTSDTRERQLLLLQCRALIGEDDAHRDEIARTLRYPANIPPVYAPADLITKRAAA